MLYPLKFVPILKKKIWGGTKLEEMFGRSADGECFGESWELSSVPGSESVVAEGDFEGRTINDLIKEFTTELLGEKVFKKFRTDFPLLFKLIDASEDLSIQVHPNDEHALKRHNSYGKAEMWYVIEASDDAEMIVGFRNNCSKEEYQHALSNHCVMNLLNKVSVKAGDVLFIPPGTVHSIGKNILLAEIQQSSEITYRIYDFDRLDTDGKKRELHTDDAFDVINFNKHIYSKTDYSSSTNLVTPLLSSQYFSTNLIPLDALLTRDLSAVDSFVVLMCIEGEVSIKALTHLITLTSGETVLIPACISKIELVPIGFARLLETYID